MTASPVRTPTVSDAIDGAIHALSAQGHGTGQDLDPRTGHLCLHGALIVGCGIAGLGQDYRNGPVYYTFRGGSQLLHDDLYQETLHAVRRALPAVWLTNSSAFFDVTSYNDHVCQGAEDAILILKHAKELL